MLYDAIRQYRLLESIDTAVCAGDLLKLCAVSYGKLFSSIDSNDDSCGAADSEDAIDEPIRLQQHKLPDLESHLHVEHAELIAEVEKKGFLMTQNFPVAAASGCFRENKLLHLHSLTQSFALIYGKNTFRRVIQRPIRITCVNTVGLF